MIVAARFADAPRELRDQATRSARVTHAHPLAIDAAVAQAAAIAATLRGEEILAAARAAAATAVIDRQLALAERLLNSGASPGRACAALGNSPLGHESVPTAILAAASHGFEDAVAFAVRGGGDTDTLGAMTGAIAGARDGATSIPTRWLQALEDGSRGRSHVEGLAEKIAAASGG
jgi:poly(ADP-ribose) glycohydrolase ARH3